MCNDTCDCKAETAALVAAAANYRGAAWSGVLAVEGTDTGDNRHIANESLSWETPMPLRRVREDRGGHDGAVTVGAIETVERMPNGEIAATGVLFNTRDGMEAYEEMYARYTSSKMAYGVSVDLDSGVVEYEEYELESGEKAEKMVVTSARLRGATLCDVPAYATAYVQLADEAEQEEENDAEEIVEDDDAVAEDDAEEMAALGRAVAAYLRSESRSLTAASPKPTAPPAAFFSNPRFEMPTPLTVTAQGRVFGHLALWETCHTGFQNVCVKAPKNFTGYSYFHTGLVVADNGSEIPVGHISLGGGHADPRAGMKATVDHYDSTSTVVADIAVGEDEHGIWFSGATRDLTPAQLAELRSAPLSGDWREMRGTLELCAALAVVVPGFNVPRTRALVASGAVKSLTASVAIEEAPVAENTEEVASEEPETPAADAVEPVAADPDPDAEAVADEAPVEEATVAADEPADDAAAELVDADEPVELVDAIEHDDSAVLEALDRLAGFDPMLAKLSHLDALVGGQ